MVEGDGKPSGKKKRSGNAGTRERKKRGREAKAADTDGQRTLGVGGRLERRGGGEAELVMTGAPAQGTGGGSAGSAGHAAPPRARRVACRTSSRLQDAPGLNSVCLCVCAFLVDPKPAGAGAWLGLEEATRPRPRQTMGKKARLPTVRCLSLCQFPLLRRPLLIGRGSCPSHPPLKPANVRVGDELFWSAGASRHAT